MIGRREFTVGAVVLAAASRPAWTQSRVRSVAILSGVSIHELAADTGDLQWSALFAELKRRGYEEGRSLAVTRYTAEGLAEGQYERLAARIVASRPDVIIVQGSRLALAVKAATSAIPVVFAGTAPIEFGLVQNLYNPGGNVTGFASDTGAEFVGKQVSLLVEAVGRIDRLCFFGAVQAWMSPGGTGANARKAAESLGIETVPILTDLVSEDAIRSAFGRMSSPAGGNALYLGNSSEFLVHARLIADLAMAARLPAVSHNRRHAEAGLLMTYGIDTRAQFSGVADYVDRILKGADPGRLPVQQPMRFDFVINLKTARALGLTVPESLLVFATEVIE